MASLTILLSKEDDLTETFRGDWRLTSSAANSAKRVLTRCTRRFGSQMASATSAVSEPRTTDITSPGKVRWSGVEALDEAECRLISIKMLANSATRNTPSVHGTKREFQVEFIRWGVFVTTNRGVTPRRRSSPRAQVRRPSRSRAFSVLVLASRSCSPTARRMDLRVG